MDRNYAHEDVHDYTVAMLLASLLVDMREDWVCEVTGYPAQFVRERVARLRETGLWTDGPIATVQAALLDENFGGVAFLLAVMCVEGDNLLRGREDEAAPPTPGPA